jgi:hypothetical protein
MFQRQVTEKIKTHILSSEEYDALKQTTDDKTRRIACWISKATDTHCEYVIIIAFPLQQWLSERAFFLSGLYVNCLSSSDEYFLKSNDTLQHLGFLNVCHEI